jgi:hypothetical protein
VVLVQVSAGARARIEERGDLAGVVGSDGDPVMLCAGDGRLEVAAVCGEVGSGRGRARSAAGRRRMPGRQARQTPRARRGQSGDGAWCLPFVRGHGVVETIAGVDPGWPLLGGSSAATTAGGVASGNCGLASPALRPRCSHGPLRPRSARGLSSRAARSALAERPPACRPRPTSERPMLRAVTKPVRRVEMRRGGSSPRNSGASRVPPRTRSVATSRRTPGRDCPRLHGRESPAPGDSDDRCGRPAGADRESAASRRDQYRSGVTRGAGYPMRNPVLAGIIGALRAWTVAMISAFVDPLQIGPT